MKYIFLLVGIACIQLCNAQSGQKTITQKTIDKNFGINEFHFKINTVPNSLKADEFQLLGNPSHLVIISNNKLIGLINYDSVESRSETNKSVKFASKILLDSLLQSYAESTFSFKDLSFVNLTLKINDSTIFNINAGSSFHCTNHTNPVHTCQTFPAFASPPCITRDCIWKRD